MWSLLKTNWPSRDLLVSQTELAQAKSNYEVAARSLDLLQTQGRERDVQIAESRTVEVWGELVNAGRALRSGVFGSLDVLIETLPDSLVVPLPAVQFIEGTQKGFVLAVDEKQLAHRREVQCGTVFTGKVHILQGLQPGELVIVEGGYGLPEGTAVRWTEDKRP